MRIHIKTSPKKCDVSSRVFFWIILFFCHVLKNETQKYTRKNNPHEPISNTYEDEGKRSFLEKPVPKIFNKNKSHIRFDDDKACNKLTHAKSSEEYPKKHHCVCKDEAEEKLKKYHRYHLGSLWLLFCFEVRECVEPEFACRARRVIPDPPEEKKYCHTHDERPWVEKRYFHKVKKSHSVKVKI